MRKCKVINCGNDLEGDDFFDGYCRNCHNERRDNYYREKELENEREKENDI